MRILIVEDSKTIRTTLAAATTGWGYEVVSAASGEEAWEIIRQEPPRLMITDWMMPGMDGPTLCRKVRETASLLYVYIILLTALEDTQSLVEGMEAGADDFVRKPVNFEELRARIRAGERLLNLEQTLQTQNRRLTELSEELQAAHAQIRRDLVMAGQMQQSLLPPPATIIDGVHFERLYRPSAMHVSGDILNYFRLDEQTIAFYVIDVAGHGVAAAMVSFNLNRLLAPDMNRGSPLKRPILAAPFYELVLPPERAITELNQQFQTDSDTIQYFTMVYGVVDTGARTIALCQAGHPNPLYVRRGAPPEFVGKGGLPVGILPTAEYESITLHYNSADRLFLYSDGITECQNADGDMFGDERLKMLFENTGDLPLAEVLERLRLRLCEWRGGEHFEDDVSVLCVEFP